MKGARDAIKSSFHHWRASGCLTAKSPMIVGWGDFVDGSTNRMQPSASRASCELQGFILKGSATV